MGSAEKFCLRWNDFESNISVAFRELREDKDFFDVTLACDDDQIQAHKVILSACSPFFKTVLKRNQHEHPMLYLKGVKYADLVAVLDFMYHGEVNVAQEELNSFLAIAEDLKVKGLTQNKSGELSNQQNEVKNTKTRVRDPLEEKQEPKLQHKRSRPVPVPEPPKRMNTIQQSYQTVEDDIQEVVPVKTEPVSLPPEQAQHIHVVDSIQHNQMVDNNLDNSIDMYEEDYAEYENYEEGTDAAYDNDNELITAANVEGNRALDLAISNSMALVYDEMAGAKVWQCLHCNKTNKYKSVMSRHVESHLEGHSHSCSICHKTYKTKLSLTVHMTRDHRKQI